MSASELPNDELRAAVAARRELGPDYEQALVDSFLERVGHEIDRKVEERLAQRAPQDSGHRGMSAGLTYFSVIFGVGGTIALVGRPDGLIAAIVMLVALTVINVAVALRERRR
ncbi:hypothetical protein ACWCSD_32615 [Nonomuraea sp. NPDC001684]